MKATFGAVIKALEMKVFYGGSGLRARQIRQRRGSCLDAAT